MSKSLETYLNDHLTGAVGAIQEARRCIEENAGTRLAEVLTRVLDEVEEDRRTLESLMDQVGAGRNSLKQAGAWIGEKVSRLKFGHEDRALSNLLSVETLVLGVEGKRRLWRSLRELAARQGAFPGVDFDALVERAESQIAGLEQERLALVQAALGSPAGVEP